MLIEYFLLDPNLRLLHDQFIRIYPKLSYLDIIPAHIDLVGIEIEFVNSSEREYLLKNSISKIKNKYDFIIIDCPPSLGLLTINALSAANSIIIPIQCEYLALEGLGTVSYTHLTLPTKA